MSILHGKQSLLVCNAIFAEVYSSADAPTSKSDPKTESPGNSGILVADNGAILRPYMWNAQVCCWLPRPTACHSNDGRSRICLGLQKPSCLSSMGTSCLSCLFLAKFVWVISAGFWRTGLMQPTLPMSLIRSPRHPSAKARMPDHLSCTGSFSLSPGPGSGFRLFLCS